MARKKIAIWKEKYFHNLLVFSVFLFAFFNLYLRSSRVSSVISANNQSKVLSTSDYVIYKNMPVLKADTQPIELTAQSVYAMDAITGDVLFEKNPNMLLLPASTTKILTALVALDYYPLDTVITVPTVNIDGQKMRLEQGEKMTVENLLYALLIYSANDAAEVLARSYSGGRNTFIEAMNLKAFEIGLKDSYFANPSGLDGIGQVTTARDLTIAGNYAMNNEQFAKIVGTKEKLVKSVDGVYSHKLTNINVLLGQVEGVLGVKTGWTEEAKENLVTYVERDGRKVVMTLLGSEDRFGETKKLIDWTYANYAWVKVPKKYYSP